MREGYFISGRGSAWLERLVRDQEVGGSNPLAPTTSPPQIQHLHAAFLEAIAAGFGCESCETLVGRTKPRPIFSHHLRRYFTSSRSCSAYWSVRSLCARVPSTFSPDPTAHDPYGAKTHGSGGRCGNRIFLCPSFSKSDEDCRAEHAAAIAAFRVMSETGKSIFLSPDLRCSVSPRSLVQGPRR
jgi:hypothetical protein